MQYNRYTDPAQRARESSPGWRYPHLSRGKWNFPIKLMVATLVIPGFFTFGHLFFARGDLDALRDCERRVGAANCRGIHGTYDEIVADCEAWPPVLTEQLSGFVEGLCAIALPAGDST